MMSVMLELIILLLSVAANVILAGIVFIKSPQQAVNRYFAFFAFTFVGWAVTNFISVHPIFFEQLFWIRLDIAWAAVMSMALLLLTNVFPVGTAFFKNLKKYALIFGTFVALLALSPWLFLYVDYTSGSAQPVPGPAIAPFVIFVLGTLVLSIYILIRQFRELKGRWKEYIRYALIGVVLTFLLLVIFNFILVLVFKNTSFIVFTPAFGLIFTTSFAYGMVRHRLFDIRLIITRFLSYLFLLVFTGAIYGAAIATLSFVVIGIQPSFIQIIFSTIVAGLLILLAQPMREFFNRVTRAFFYQEAYDTKDVLDKLVSVIVRTTETKTLATKSMNILKSALKSDYITMVILDTKNGSHHRTIHVGQLASKSAKLASLKVLADIPDIIVTDTLDDRHSDIREEMLAADISIIARLETHSGIIGFCLFGYKSSGSAYSQRDIDLIRIARDELAIAIENAVRFDQIEEFNDTLQQRIEDATKELRASNTQLQKLDEAKDEFVSMASHQLRTPLTSVKGYISMVLEGDAGKITGMQRQLLGEAFTSSERMVHLINDFLNVSRLQTGKFMIEKHAIDLSKIITQEVESLQTTAQAHDLKLVYRPPAYFPILYIDEGKIRQVLMNFIDNAIYYSPESTTITVVLTIEDGFAVLQVHDTGIGVPQAEQARLFTKFYRASNARKQRPDGTGVGLFLAKKVIVAHGGTMVFSSVEGEGSTFGFRLPIKKLSEASAKSADELDK
ncbi:MAG TPA: ATP-binding protein [Candidatus Saccharimonadales bacterium]|nr:ATP-binding protein [Candidatus Saccharimonadales bacterium]